MTGMVLNNLLTSRTAEVHGPVSPRNEAGALCAFSRVPARSFPAINISHSLGTSSVGTSEVTSEITQHLSLGLSSGCSRQHLFPGLGKRSHADEWPAGSFSGWHCPSNGHGLVCNRVCSAFEFVQCFLCWPSSFIFTSFPFTLSSFAVLTVFLEEAVAKNP